MSTWYQIDVEKAAVASGALHRLCRAFQHAYIRAGAPDTLALFARRVNDDAGRCLYASPAAVDHTADLLDAYAARPCARPRGAELTLLYGAPESERLLRCPPIGGDGAAAPVAGPSETDG